MAGQPRATRPVPACIQRIRQSIGLPPRSASTPAGSRWRHPALIACSSRLPTGGSETRRWCCRCGINNRGRGTQPPHLQAILHTVESVLGNMPADDLDAGADTPVENHSLFGGPDPELLEMQGMEQAAECPRQWIAMLRQAFDHGLQDICLECRTNRRCEARDEATRNANPPTHRIQTLQDTRETGSMQLVAVQSRAWNSPRWPSWMPVRGTLPVSQADAGCQGDNGFRSRSGRNGFWLIGYLGIFNGTA